MKTAYSASELSRLCRLDRRTVSLRLARVPRVDGSKGSHLYELQDALPALCRRETAEAVTERERLTRAQADLAELEYRERANELVPLKAALCLWENVMRVWRAKIIASHLTHEEQAELFKELRTFSEDEVLAGIS